MQIMPRTAESLEIADPTDPEQSLRGGTAYLSELWEEHEDITDSIQRIKFTLASYNAGLYHVEDAQRLAQDLGLDAQLWDNNVENAILKLSQPKFYTKDFIKYGYVRGRQPFLYVRDIFKRYEHYKAFIPESADDVAE
jgi:membrane-bound lytic murein transglycosylase F